MSTPPSTSHVRDALSQVTWQEFEYLMAEYYRAEGWDVRHVGTAGEAKRFDGGVDLELRRDDEWVLVQCKHWRKQLVPHNALHELIGVVTTRGASRGIVVTSGQFTPAARAAARQQQHVRLIDGNDVCRMLAPWLEGGTTSVGHPLPPLQPLQNDGWAAAAAHVRARRKPTVVPPWPVLVLSLLCALALIRCGVSALVGATPALSADARPARERPSPPAQRRPAAADVRTLPAVKVAPATGSPASNGAGGAYAPSSPASPPRDPDKAIRVIEATTPEM